MEDEREKKRWLDEEETRIRDMLEKHRLREKASAEHFQNMEEKARDAREKQALAEEEKREKMRVEADALREERQAASAASLDAQRERERLEVEHNRFQREKDSMEKRARTLESVESALRKREAEAEGMSAKVQALEKALKVREKLCEDKENYLAESQKDLFARLKEETDRVAEQRNTLRDEQEASMIREKEWRKTKLEEDFRLDRMKQALAKREAIADKKERDMKEARQTLRKLSEDIKEGKAKGDAETQIQRKRMQEELERGLASQSRIAEDEISKLRATMQSQFESESNEKYSAAVAAMEAIEESASRRQKSDREQILSLETKLENSLMELTRVKQEKESMEERTTHVVTEATAITEKINEMERAMLEDRAALQAARERRDRAAVDAKAAPALHH